VVDCRDRFGCFWPLFPPLVLHELRRAGRQAHLVGTPRKHQVLSSAGSLPSLGITTMRTIRTCQMDHEWDLFVIQHALVQSKDGGLSLSTLGNALTRPFFLEPQLGLRRAHPSMPSCPGPKSATLFCRCLTAPA
jgi:hypothetical protein